MPPRFPERRLNAVQCILLAALAFLVPFPAHADERRAVPDYDGRGDGGASAALWIPRVLVAPLYLVWEYLVRVPIGAAVRGVEKNGAVSRALHVATFGSAKSAGIAPTFLFDTDMLPAVGAYFWWDDALVDGNHVRIRAATWGAPLVLASLSDRYDLDERSSVSLVASFARRRDNVFYGLGPDAPDGARRRYRSRIADASAGFERELGLGIHLATRVGVRDVAFDERVVASDYTLGYQRVALAFDTRASGLRGSGLRLETTGEGSFASERRSWVTYGGSAHAFWDIGGSARVLSLAGTLTFVDPIADGAVPFTELATLGGYERMRGFLPGRMVDRSAASLTLAYRWPVWSFLDAGIEAAAGNVFGPRLRGLDAGKLRFSGAVGLRTLAIPEAELELLVGFGTATFADGMGLESVRCILGATHAF